MYIQPTSLRARGFTLIELMVVVVIMALLAALTMGAYQYAQTAAARNRTHATMAALEGGLERYNSDFGEYPAPSNPTRTDEFNGKTYIAGGAAMLYQAMSGDGTNAIDLATGGGVGSNGRIEDDEDANVKMTDIPAQIWMQQNGSYYMIDGFRKPFQYTKGGDPNAVNPTYDLWSYGQDETNTRLSSIDAKSNPTTSAKWIKNW
ncbi:MAG: prepilin-type N-terminal cleavage/methylation domain-containing protein [Verrucomicrobiales bacterium]|nr:prepilin-type N-terminal cleavage/methylation domain-containing protein [Verrucomicrobiales bacterium]